MKRSDELAMAIAPFGSLVPVALIGNAALSHVLLFGTMVAYVTALVAGWPLLVLARRRGCTQLWQLTVAGLLVSSPFAVLLYGLGLRTSIGVLLSGIVGGALVWWLAVGPNNSFKPKPLRGSA